jgi:hypothetical protein
MDASLPGVEQGEVEYSITQEQWRQRTWRIQRTATPPSKAQKPATE